jgi:hypothetical protein
LGRFVSADTIVPDPVNSQSWNRFAYVLGNPLKYTDPSGHCEWIGLGGGEGDLSDPTADEDKREQERIIRIREIEHLGPFVFENSESWTLEELLLLKEAIINHPFRKAFSSATKITLRKRDVYVDPDTGRENKYVGGFTKDLGGGVYEITIYDVAWQLEPAMNSTYLLERSDSNYAANFAHELTHVALEENPVIVTYWGISEADSHEGSVVGHARSRKGMTDEQWAQEMIAYTVAAYMYQPDALVYYPPPISCQGPRDHWSVAWVEGMESLLNSK